MSTFLSIISFIAFTTGGFILLNLSFFDFTDDLASFLNKEKKLTIKEKINQINSTEDRGIRKVVNEAKTILEITGRSEKMNVLWIASIIFFIIGVVFSLSVGNIFLVPVLAIGLALLPFWYIIYTSHSYQKETNEELESALSTITTSYLRSENIIQAVEENIDYLNPPVSEVFSFFLSQTKLITSNTKLAIKNIKPKIHNEVFQEWCDVLISCMDNKNLKYTLVPIVQKLSDERVVSAELDTMLYEPMKEYITMAILLFSNIPIIKMLNKDWYKILVTTIWGKAALAVCVLVVFISLGGVIKHTRPIEYKA
ncbi:type II secretion system F family protein [Sporanaerobacter acetigenes]|uniref:Flp pilus assembly protein TadB n=1 Tax=Sporanaerobacter acetigenes DSM 13106 TaxID=1123281 RepID=A0A1M5U7J9_9FIRM|nr:hypothetical protein [Sporanaerobacter acetigenes]SHH59022.1 hypothetical protein SAMN02745180_00552 [Sporanaerobacter acetigenes DSM 13106]